MSDNVKRARRTRIVGILITLYTLGLSVTLLASLPPSTMRWVDDDAPRGLVLAAAHDAIESHPFGRLMVPYEYNRLRYGVRDARNADDDARYLAGTVHVFYIVLGEMTWLLVGLLGVGLIAGLLAVFPGPAKTIWAGVLLLLVSFAPIVSVGPGSVLLTLPMLVFGILVLSLRPRFPRPAPAAAPTGAGVAGVAPPPASPIAGPAKTHPGREVAIGIGLIVLGIGTAVLAANLNGSRVAKVWIGAAAALGMGLWLLISGLIHLGRKSDD